jgi:hypothetical protein
VQETDQGIPQLLKKSPSAMRFGNDNLSAVAVAVAPPKNTAADQQRNAEQQRGSRLGNGGRSLIGGIIRKSGSRLWVVESLEWILLWAAETQ